MNESTIGSQKLWNFWIHFHVHWLGTQVIFYLVLKRVYLVFFTIFKIIMTEALFDTKTFLFWCQIIGIYSLQWKILAEAKKVEKHQKEGCWMLMVVILIFFKSEVWRLFQDFHSERLQLNVIEKMGQNL